MCRNWSWLSRLATRGFCNSSRKAARCSDARKAEAGPPCVQGATSGHLAIPIATSNPFTKKMPKQQSFTFIPDVLIQESTSIKSLGSIHMVIWKLLPFQVAGLHLFSKASELRGFLLVSLFQSNGLGGKNGRRSSTGRMVHYGPFFFYKQAWYQLIICTYVTYIYIYSL